MDLTQITRSGQKSVPVRSKVTSVDLIDVDDNEYSQQGTVSVCIFIWFDDSFL